MKRIHKKPDSEVIRQQLNYPKDAQKIKEILEVEQECFCAYTEERITAGYAVDVEHFNPTWKNTPADGYNNWFVVSHKWNNKKRTKWENYQPVLHPTDESLENRILYEEGFFILDKVGDVPAAHLIGLLDLNNQKLIHERQQYVKRLKGLAEVFGGNEGVFAYLSRHPEEVKFRRALEVEFGFRF